jgi:cell division septal protein FtsQ
LGLALLIILAAGAIGYAAVVAAADPRFALADVGVRGAHRATIDDIRAAAALPAGRNIWLLNTAAARRRIEAMPWIASATIERGWPNQVAIAVTERVPAARVALAFQQYVLVDADGRVLGDADDNADQALPVLAVQPLPPGAGTAGTLLAATAVGDALATAKALTALGVHVTEIQTEPVMGISAFTDANVRVVFGDLEDLARKVALYDAIRKRITQPDAVEYVDVRSIAAPTVQYRR